jgi:alkanesulfonate monooxygenase SsuD/methylene tetrahydromethanopterin reductase-like flavin-dependent oxidoreductase (luciferase family)
MEFGFTLKPEHSIERTLALTRRGEAAGFACAWLFDSHVLWREPYVLDYLHHAEAGSSNADFVTDDIVDRFGIVGDVDAHVAKLRVLAQAGVDQFNLYLMNGNEEEQLEIYGRQIIPALRDVRAAKA